MPAQSAQLSVQAPSGGAQASRLVMVTLLRARFDAGMSLVWPGRIMGGHFPQTMDGLFLLVAGLR